MNTLIYSNGIDLDTGDYTIPSMAVDEIRSLLDAGDVEAAIARKCEFETQISPSLRRSKDLLGQISAGIGAVQAV